MPFESTLLTEEAPTAGVRRRVEPLRRWIVFSLIGTALLGMLTFGVTVGSTNGFLIWGDGVGYFSYARSLVVDLDTDVTNEYEELSRRFSEHSKLMQPLYAWSSRGTDGRIHLPWPPGSGVVMTPFYAVGYGIERVAAGIAHRPADSYGIIPQYFYGLGTLAYAVLGFWAMFMTCRAIADERVAYLSALGITFAGPLLFYAFFNPTMAHASSFGLVALLTLLWWRQWNEGASVRVSALLGLLLGLLITIRYQNALFGIPVAALVLRQVFVRPWRESLALAAITGLAALLPLAVLVPFDVFAGLFSSQGAPGAPAHYPIDLSSPFFFHVLLSCRHGAFHWAPIFALGFIGLLFAASKQGWAVVLLITFLAHAYLIGGLGLANSEIAAAGAVRDWHSHWGGAPSFGMRYLTETGPLLALGLAVLLQAGIRRVGYAASAVLLVALVAWNALLIVAYGLETISRSQCLPYSEMAVGIARALGQMLARAL